MAEVVVEGDDVVVRLSPLEKVGAFRGDVHVTCSAIRGARVAVQPFTEVRGLRAPGTALPGRIALGTWRRRGGVKDFVAVYRNRPAVVIDLDRAVAGYDRLVVSVGDADDARRRLTA